MVPLHQLAHPGWTNGQAWQKTPSQHYFLGKEAKNGARKQYNMHYFSDKFPFQAYISESILIHLLLKFIEKLSITCCHFC